MHTVKVFCWFVVRLVLPKGSPLGYDRVVHLLYDFSLSYQLQVYAAVVVLTMQALCELLLWLLDMPYLRLRTWVLLNHRVSEGCVTKMYGSAPAPTGRGGDAADSPPMAMATPQMKPQPSASSASTQVAP